MPWCFENVNLLFHKLHLGSLGPVLLANATKDTLLTDLLYRWYYIIELKVKMVTKTLKLYLNGGLKMTILLVLLVFKNNLFFILEK